MRTKNHSPTLKAKWGREWEDVSGDTRGNGSKEAVYHNMK